MQPFLLDQTAIDAYLDAGYWTRDTMAGRYAAHAAAYPNKLACRDAVETYSWKRLDEVTDDIAANLVALGIARDARALVQMASSARELGNSRTRPAPLSGISSSTMIPSLSQRRRKSVMEK